MIKGYDFEKTIHTPLEELLGIEEQMPNHGIKDIEEMGRFIKRHYSSKLFKLNKKHHILHGIDSTELPIDCQRLLAPIKINGQKIRIYDDIDSDCGRRRNKRDKSIYVAGYRLHTLTVIDAKTGHSYPLVSLPAPANHHDSMLLAPLVKLGKAMGIDLKLITADEAYTDSDGTFFKETGVHLITPPKSNVISVHENVDAKTMTVTCHDSCSIPMEYNGFEEGYHEYKCCAVPGECPFASKYPQFRHIPLDGGLFQHIPFETEHVSKAIEIRKNAERPFNLLKKRKGLETTRVRNQHNLLARCTFTTIFTLLLEMAETLKKKKVKKIDNWNCLLPE